MPRRFMALTLANYKAHAKHALGGEPAVIVSSAEATKQQIVNDAGRILMGLAPWRWAESTPTTVTVTAGSDNAALPADFAELASSASGSSTYRVTLTQFDDLLRLRAAGGANDPANDYWFSIVQPLPGAPTSVMPPPRVELYPVAGQGNVAIRVLYRRGWAELTNDTHYPSMPPDFEPLLIALVRAVARGYEEDQLEALVAAVVSSPICQGLIDRDARMRPDPKRADIPRGGRS